MYIHIVRSGETLESIAEEYGVSRFVITMINGIDESLPLVKGQALLILMPQRYHTVQPKDTLSSVAASYGVSLNQLYRNNPLLNGSAEIYPGQTLIIKFQSDKSRKIDTNGYAYPYINETLLKRTLPYINYLTPFTYGITESGGLVDLNDFRLIELALNYGVLPLMHLSTLTENGGFSNELAHLVLNNESVQENLIDEIINNIQTKDYRGLDIDFEFVYADDSLPYAEFIERLRNTLNPLGYEVIAALAPKTSDEQKGLLYEGHNYRAIGNAANAVLLMTYEWGYTYSEPMAVAPIGNVRRVVDYALGSISPGNVFMGIPNYGYDWTLPYVKGETRARSIGNDEAIRIAAENNAQINYDTAAQTPWFNYTDSSGNEHEVWFEDVRSIQKKLELIKEKELRGAGYWNLMRPFQQNWSLLDYMFEIDN